MKGNIQANRLENLIVVFHRMNDIKTTMNRKLCEGIQTVIIAVASYSYTESHSIYIIIWLFEIVFSFHVR